MHWSTALYEAAERFDGGARSFPIASEAAFASKYGYEPPNEDYEKLFSCQAAIPRSQRDRDVRPHSAGWLVPDPADASVCKPVFIAHSVLSAIWLLRETLADDALTNDSWDRLVCAAQSLAEDGMAEPPSAQKSPLGLVSQRAKRQAPAAQASPSPPKRTRTEEDLEMLEASPLPSEPASEQEVQPDERLAEEQRPATTVTNRNRDAERKRIKDREAALIERRLDLGLVAPDAKAANEEVGAYVAVPAKDQAVISWLFRQDAVDRYRRKTDFYNAVKTPYLKARDFLAKARALGSPSSQEHAAHFLQAWRKRGELFGGSGGAAAHYSAGSSQTQHAQHARVSSADSSQQDGAERTFRAAWERCNVYDRVMKSVHIEYRWAQALLGKALTDKLDQIKQSDGLVSNDKKSRFGKGQRRTEAIDALMPLVNSNRNPSKHERDGFRDYLARAVKWYRIAEGLGWGVLLVMPEDVIHKSWIEQDIRSWGIDVFIELVQKERPDVCIAAKQFDEWLGADGIAGGDIKGKAALSIEVEPPQQVYEVEEIGDSEEDSDEDDEAADRRVEVAQTPIYSQRAPAARLRQTTLPELFQAALPC